MTEGSLEPEVPSNGTRADKILRKSPFKKLLMSEPSRVLTII